MSAIITDPLLAASLRVLRDGQAPSGAFVASPAFSQYGFAWMRDGSYCALAMDALGDADAAERFHAWAAGVIVARAGRVQAAVEAFRDGRPPAASALLPARYTLDGGEETPSPEAWPNFQLDGYGTWLFALHRHFANGLPPDYAGSVRLAADYIAAGWRTPCYDYWEEHGERLHTSTLAALAAGLRAAARMLGESAYDDAADAIVAFVRSSCVIAGVFVKGPDDERVDASLISLTTPFGLFDAADPTMSATIERIRRELASPSGGIRRYVGDTYYGGSPWILLTAWLGWHDRLGGDQMRYASAVRWVRDHADPNGDLAEQAIDEPQAAEFVEPWIDRWGPVADPLLWSHAKYVLLELGGEAQSWS